jgi:heme/copper-type cytochrome/quinol oxidase subunit 3
VTLALPAPAPAPPKRQLLVATALFSAAATMVVGGMLATWVLLRSRAVDAGERFPEGYIISEVPSNIMLMTVGAICVFAQWAVYAAARRDRLNTGLALGATWLLGAAFINAQAFIWVDMGVEIAEGGYAIVFYAVTGLMVALALIGLVMTAIAAFRFLGGHLGETEMISATALYWYFLAAAFAAVWFVVYVTK